MNITQTIGACCTAFYSVATFANTSMVYVNGDILTMQGDAPQYVEAIVVQDDKIIFSGDKIHALTLAGPNPTLYDLKGHTLMPGFIDSWGHFALVAQNTLGVNLGYFAQRPPSTKAQAINKLLAEVWWMNYSKPILTSSLAPMTAMTVDLKWQASWFQRTVHRSYV